MYVVVRGGMRSIPGCVPPRPRMQKGIDEMRKKKLKRKVKALQKLVGALGDAEAERTLDEPVTIQQGPVVEFNVFVIDATTRRVFNLPRLTQQQQLAKAHELAAARDDDDDDETRDETTADAAAKKLAARVEIDAA